MIEGNDARQYSKITFATVAATNHSFRGESVLGRGSPSQSVNAGKEGFGTDYGAAGTDLGPVTRKVMSRGPWLLVG